MSTPLQLTCLLLGLSVAACGGAPVADPAPDVDIAACDEPIGGPFALPAATAVEAVPGYDAALQSANLKALPETLEMADVGPLEQALIAYMLELPKEQLGDSLDRDELLAVGPMGRAVVFAFYVADQKHWFGVDTDSLRRGLQRFYACTRGVPMRLDDFKKAVLNPADLPFNDVQSDAKNETRRLTENAEAGFWMAQTIVDGEVRETEIILSDRRRDGALDFLAYDENGRLMDRSRFETPDGVDISGAAPYVCIICHSKAPDFFPDTVYPTLGL